MLSLYLGLRFNSDNPGPQVLRAALPLNDELYADQHVLAVERIFLDINYGTQDPLLVLDKMLEVTL